MKHTMESDIRVLEAGGYGILSYTRTRNGHVILWFGDIGCTITVRTPKGISVSNTLPFEIAKAKYMQEIQELI